jgi:hypothetical protein
MKKVVDEKIINEEVENSEIKSNIKLVKKKDKILNLYDKELSKSYNFLIFTINETDYFSFLNSLRMKDFPTPIYIFFNIFILIQFLNTSFKKSFYYCQNCTIFLNYWKTINYKFLILKINSVKVVQKVEFICV